MKKEVSIFIFLFLLQNCATKSNQNLKCNDFKSGKFELINAETHRKYIIERNQNFQIEKTFNLSTNEKLQNDKYFFIVWKNECEYQLKIDTAKSEYDEIDLYMNSMGGLQNKIMKIDGKCAEIETILANQTHDSKICKQ